MAASYIEHYTFEDYKHSKGDWELIHDMPPAMAPFTLPSHRRISVKIVRELDESLDGCKNCYALIDSEVKFRDYTIIRANVMVKCGEIDIVTITPEIVFEVVSKDSIQKDELECNVKVDFSKV